MYSKHIDATIVEHYHHYLISMSGLGLFHGRDCFDAYAPVCSNPQIVHNIHLKRHDSISAERLRSKVDAIRAHEPLKIGYVGRADATKGAWDWLDVVKRLVDTRVDLQANWLGYGPLLAELRDKVQQLRLNDKVHFPGFVADRADVLEFLRDCHLLVFLLLSFAIAASSSRGPSNPRNRFYQAQAQSIGGNDHFMVRCAAWR